MEKLLDSKEVKWGLIGVAVLIVPFWLAIWPLSLAVILVALHALGVSVPLHPLRLLGALTLGLSVMVLDYLQTVLPQLDHPEIFLLVPFLFGANMMVGGFVPRVKRLLRPGRLIGLGLVWLAFYLFAPSPDIGVGTFSQLGWIGWLVLSAGAFGLVVGDYHRPLAGLRDLRPDSYWHGERLTEREEAVRAGGREGEKAVQAVIEGLKAKQYVGYHGVHLRSLDRQLPKSQEFDHIVIGPNGVFNLETKNWRGKVVIKPSGEWLRVDADGKAREWESPAEQVERHRRVLRSVLRDLYVPIVDCLVMTNQNTVIEGQQHSPVRIIRVQQLQQLIEGWQPDQPLDKELRAKISQRIRQNIIPAEQFETGGRFIWQLWHWFVIDALGAAIFFWLAA